MDGVSEERLRIPVDGDELDAVAVFPEQGTHRWAILVHGGPAGVKDGPADLYRNLAATLVTQGIGSLRFDVRGAGQSTGAYRDTTLARQSQDLKAARQLLVERYAPQRIALIGESLGATIVLSSLEGNESALVLLWPAIWLLDGPFDGYLDEESLTEAKQWGFIVRDGEEIGLPFLNELLATRDVSQPLHGLRTPLLLVHGDADTEVPVEQSAQAEALVAGPVRRVVVPGGDHCLERPAERVVVDRETSEWLAAHL
jgi:fermentation-respiration switch protein FrsA (DUF1100 family)